MLTYLLRRTLLMIPTLLGITLVVFAVMAASPGGISAQGLIEGNLEPEARRALEDYYNQRYGLDDPLPVQYWNWLKNISPFGSYQAESASVAKGLLKTPDMGTSFLYGRPVTELIAERLPITLLLNIFSIPLVYLFAIAIGVQAATRRGQSFDVASGTALLALWSVPVMLAGILLIGLFASAQNWHWFPESGLSSRAATEMPFLPHWGSVWQVLTFIGLTIALCVSFVFISRHSRMGRATLFSLVGALAGYAMGSSIGQASGSLLLPICVVVLAASFAWIGLVGSRGFCTVFAILLGTACTWYVAFNVLDQTLVPGFLLDRLWHLALPVICLSFGSLAFLAKLTRSSILENLAADYARTARAKGASESTVLWRHVFRNSLIPLITVAAALLPGLLAGSVVVESLFSIDGMGKLAVEAVKGRDRELVLSLTLISGVLTLLGYLLADLFYALADPRVSYD